MADDQQTSQGEKPRLTVDDGVAPETMNRLRLLQESRLDISDRFLTLEQEKVKLLAAARRVDEEKSKVFEGILLERGLPPDAIVEIDASTGKIKVLSKTSEPAQAPTPPQAQQPPTS